MKAVKTSIEGVLIIEPETFSDERGFFMETWNKDIFQKITGVNVNFVQDNYSFSYKNILRGLHYQLNNPQGKLVRVSSGSVLDVALDLRKSSTTFGQYVGAELSDKNHRQLWIPPGYAHGFCVLSKSADFYYKCTDFYDPNDEGGLAWNDPYVAIDWPINKPNLSSKDANLPTLADLKQNRDLKR